MASLESQYLLAEDIEQEYKNYKKDGASRKNNVEYFKRRWNRLEELWNEFQFKHDQLCSEVSRTDPYFMDQCYEKLQTIYMKFKNQINEEYQKFTAQASTSQEKPASTETKTKSLEKQETADQPSSEQLQSSTVDKGILSKMDETLRKQQANFKAFTRTMANFNLEVLAEKWEFEDALKALETRWSAIDALHLEIDSELDGKHLEYEAKYTKYEIQYHTLKKNINKKMWSVSYRAKFTPKLDIPIFSGNLTQWVSFKDLFSEAIHSNPTLSNGQKMQFLKSKVKGEAERLIQHLIISSDNYLTCWEILNHRYNNKRLIFTSQINILFSLPVIQQQSLTQIKKMHDVTVETIHAIKNLGVDITTWDPLLVVILTQKLDSESYTNYMESVKNPRELPVLQELLDFLESKFTTLETSARRKQEGPVPKTNIPQTSFSNMKKPSFSKQNNNNRNGHEHPRVAKTYHMSGQIICPLCDDSHGIYKCRNFLQMADDKKLNTVNKLGICINCLFSHNGKPCNSTKTCRKCLSQHNTLIHDALENSKRPSVSKPTSGATIATSAEPGPSNLHVSQVECPEVLLGTAQLKVLGADGSYHNMRALIDQGSQISLITEHAAQILGIKRQKCKGVIYGVGQRENNCKGKINITCVSLNNNYTFSTEVIIMSNLIKNLPNKTFSKPNWSTFQNVQLADPEFYISRPVDLLLGADIYSNIILSGIIKGDSVTQPIAQQTQLGWLLCGSVQTFHCNVVLNNIEDMQQFWEIEDVVEDGDLSSEDMQCLEYFNKTTRRNEDGRYEVRLPMKPNFENELGTSKPKALAQFRNIEQKFKKQENLAIAYKTFMKEYQDMNHMKLDNSQTTSLECYLPHHGVERADSTTTKYRVVFNASSKTSKGCSLNDLMFKGPNLQQDLQTLLLQWRQYPYAFTADIEKMYRQILVHEADQSLQKIVWRQSPEHPIQIFKLATVTYGTKAAPFLAMMTLRKLAADERDNFTNVSKILEESFYMDDLVYGAYSVEKGKNIVNDLSKLLKLGGFNLRKWSTNEPEILQNLTNQENSGDNMIFNFKTDISKTLGLCWNPNNDRFTFKCKISTETNRPTKRTLLSEISKIFDPLGWIAPVVTKMKLIFQTVWKTNIKWDEQVPEDIYKEWYKLQADINILDEIEIPRWILCNEHDVIELHGFCDASQKAYAGVVYARIKQQKQVVLVAAKTKLVPLNKTLTLPRLELCGAHLLSKLINKVKLALNHHDSMVYGWTDSKVVIGWLQGESSRWKPFVANRVQKITEIMPEQQWRYVNTAENPADAASRGIYPSQLRNNLLWWSAPSWISTFEGGETTKQIFETDEDKKLCQTNIVQQTQNENIISNLLTKHSNFAKVTRIVAWIRRALTPKHKQQSTYLTYHELQNAKLTIIKNIQKNEFRSEIEHICKHGKVHSSSKLFNLNPFIDQDNILRVGGRLSQANIDMEMKHPKIIPQESRLADLLVDQAHKLTFHGGPRLTLGYLRQEYWITGGNNYVKKQLRKCVTCRKYEGKTQQQLMGDLPAARVNPAYPFYHTGVDYTGFVDVKYNKGRGVKTTKGYVAIFVCMVTKAVHLELVSELTSSAFLAALRRMTARRGAPRHLYSDNGTNFVGANRILQQEWQQLQQTFDDNFQTEIAEMKIDWHFNAPAWPSAGGLWERAVRSLKHHLRRVVGDQKLTFEEYSTILAQLEACLNSRPLCALTEDIGDLDFLTPANFLTGRAGVTIIETSEDARTRWHLTQKLLQDIWKRWKAEYLTQLTARPKWQTPQQNLKIGDMVVLHDDNLPPGKWTLGRVVESHPGKDGYVRVVTLKTKNGYTKRPVVKLSVLPLDTPTEKPKQTSIPESVNQTENKQSSSVPQNVKRTRRQTKQKPSFGTIALMCFYLLSMLTSGWCFKIAKVDENKGIYFDKLANMQLIRDEWKIITYYDMQPYWEGTTTYQQYYQYLDSICLIIKQLTNCKTLMLQLSHEYSELEHNNRVLLHQQISARARRRRGVINGVGYLANTLFGVLDDRFAEQYERDITLIRNNQKHLASLWKNQTSVIEAEFNLLKRTEDSLQKLKNMTEQHLVNLDKATNTLAKNMNEIAYITEFTLSAMTANNILIQLKNMQDSLLDTITSVYHGKINLHLIDPQQLQDQLSIISGQLSKETALPIDNIQTDMQNIYQLLKVKAKITRKYMIIEITVPLISRDNYILYNVVSIPHQVGRNMVSIIPIERHVAMNLQKDSYLPVTLSDLEHCTSKDSSSYLCQLKTPIFKLNADTDLCVKDIDKATRCQTRVATCANRWISLTKVNQYIYFCCDQCQLRVICNDQAMAPRFTGVNLVNIEENCLVKTENFTIYSHKLQSNRMDVKYNLEVPEIDPINHIINISVNHVDLNITDFNNNQQLRELEEKIKILKQNEALPNSISTHDVHHYVLIWCLCVAVSIIVILYICRRRCLSCRQAASARARAESTTRVEPDVHLNINSVKCECSARNQSDECSERTIVNEPVRKNKGTTPVLRKISFSANSPERFNLQKAWRRQRKQEKLDRESKTEQELEAYTAPPIEGPVEISPNGLNGEILHEATTDWTLVKGEPDPPELPLGLMDDMAALEKLRQYHILANMSNSDEDEEPDNDYDYSFY